MRVKGLDIGRAGRAESGPDGADWGGVRSGGAGRAAGSGAIFLAATNMSIGGGGGGGGG